MSPEMSSSGRSPRPPRDFSTVDAQLAARRHVRIVVLRFWALIGWIRGLVTRTPAPASRVAAEASPPRPQPSSARERAPNPTLSTLRRVLAAVLSVMIVAGQRGLALAWRGLSLGATALGPAAARAFAWIWARRQQALALTLRLLWWTALVLLIRAGAALGDPSATGPLDEVALPRLLVGFALSAIVLVLARPWRLRVGAFALGLAHGALALVTWVVTTPL
ncbi:MAG: hypothetical protein H6713_08280 [Myxococcales bacterium]|nr:hypothetical protein [Myxococcales bacterium]MCB9749985.1 hypothetical protein [Myxococcales bacterium]